MNPYALIACMVAVLGVGAGGFKLGVDHQIASQEREDKHVQQAIEAANIAAAEAIAKIKVVNTTVQNEVQHEIRTNTIYAGCKHSPDGLRLLNEALAGSIPAADRKLPKADAAQ